jgi:tetratricopeptide (TPR) repeat protein
MRLLTILGLLLALCSSTAFAGSFDDLSQGILAAVKGQDQKAIAKFDQVIKKNDLSPRQIASVYYNRGKSWKAEGYSGKALKDFNQALKLNPRLAAAYLARGELLQSWNKYEQALADYSRAMEAMAGYRDALQRRARLYFLMGEYPKAIEDADAIIHIDTSLPEPLLIRSLAHERLGQLEAAIKDMEFYLLLKPYDRVGERRLRKLLKDAGRLKE